MNDLSQLESTRNAAFISVGMMEPVQPLPMGAGAKGFIVNRRATLRCDAQQKKPPRGWARFGSEDAMATANVLPHCLPRPRLISADSSGVLWGFHVPASD